MLHLEICEEPVNSKLYMFLAEAYKSELNEKSAVKLLHIIRQIPIDAGETQSILDQLQESLLQITADPCKNLLALGIEYMNTFRGTGPNPVFLYEAVHRSADGLIFEEPYFEVKSRYEKSGFTVEPDWMDPEDHISVECQFLIFLGERIEQAYANGDFKQETLWQKQRDAFLQEHFIHWVPQFSEQVIHNTSHEFYRQVGLLTQNICKQISNVDSPALAGKIA
jgi:putative dimethyl sulfoxide reductase chaperone